MRLTKKEREYLSDKPFWDWQMAKIDLKSADIFHSDDKKMFKEVYKAEQFYRKLYYKLVGRRKK